MLYRTNLALPFSKNGVGRICANRRHPQFISLFGYQSGDKKPIKCCISGGVEHSNEVGSHHNRSLRTEDHVRSNEQSGSMAQ
jgi:hypothetical protein